jgi:putative ABC transport system permease protein
LVKDDIRYACRALAHARDYVSWVVGSLAIGIAVAIAALAFMNAAMFRPFPAVTNQERLVHVSVSRNCGRPDCWIRMSGGPDYVAVRDGLTGLQGVAAHAQAQLAVALPEARSIRGSLTSANFFDVLGVRVALGRAFGAADEDSHAAVAVISHSLWTREFGGDPSVLGRPIRVAGEIVHIVGVAPEFFIGIERVRPGGRGADLWLPLWMADRAAQLTPISSGD